MLKPFVMQHHFLYFRLQCRLRWPGNCHGSPVNVIEAQSINYSVSNQVLCAGGYEYIYLHGVTGSNT